MFQSEILSPAEIFALKREFHSRTWRQCSRKYPSWKFYPFWQPQARKFRFGLFDRRATTTWDCILMCDKMGQIYKFFSWRENFVSTHDASGLESIPPGNFTHFCRPTVENLDSFLLTIVRPEPGITFWGATIWLIFPNFYLEREFRSRTWRQWSRKHPSWKFHPFWPPHGRKLRFGRFDRRASKWWFWPLCDQNPCSVV